MTEKVDPNPIISPVLPDFHAKYLVEKDLRIYYQDLVYGLCSLFDEGGKVCQIGELKGKVAELLKKNAVETENNAPNCSENEEKCCKNSNLVKIKAQNTVVCPTCGHDEERTIILALIEKINLTHFGGGILQ